MANLDLRLITAGNSSVLLAISEFGEASRVLPNDFLSEMTTRSQNLRSEYAARRQRSFPIDSDVKQLGTDLFKGLFAGDVLKLFNQSIGGAESGRITIRLMLGDPHLNAIQWEIMRYRDEFVGFRHNLIRHPFVSRPVSIPSQRRGKLRVCAIAVDPIYGMKTVEQEHQDLVSLFRGFNDQIVFTSLVQEEATVDRIMDVLFAGVDIWHFNGHGSYDDANPGDSFLVVWPDDQDVREDRRWGRVSVRMLTTLAANQNLGFCFLNACDTARTSEPITESHVENSPRTDSFVNMAHSLIEAGVPMVVATNHQITVAAATYLSRRFYNAIVKYGRRVDEAVRDARAELFFRSGQSVLPSDWSCPALYARSRQMGLGTEEYKWVSSLDLYSVRNVEAPVYEVVRR